MEGDPDPAEFLLSNSEYHDWHFVVGDPVNDEVEKIGVSSIYLIANSSVFRDMWADSKLADPSGANTHITDVSPATFKLMLRLVYGGSLPELNDEEIMKLANLGARYKVHRLVEKAGKQLPLITEENIFSALTFVANYNCPALELEVGKIIQDITYAIVREKLFLELEEKSMVFIAKQDMLSITELELWDWLVRWGENQVLKSPEKTLRDYLNNVLEYVRVLTLSTEEIAEHLLPTGVLTTEELDDLICAVAMNKSMKSPGLCKNREERRLYFKSDWSFKADEVPPQHYNSLYKIRSLKERSGKKISSFSIEPSKTVKIESFTIRNQECEPNGNVRPVYELGCFIDITESLEGIHIETNYVNISEIAVFHQNIILPIKLKDDKPLVLKAGGKYTFSLSFTTPHTVYEIHETEDSPPREKKQVDITFDHHVVLSMMTVKYEDYPHVIGIAFKTS